MDNGRILLVSRNQSYISEWSEPLLKEHIRVNILSDCNEATDHLEDNFSGAVVLDSGAIEEKCPGLCKYIATSLRLPVIVIGNDSYSGEKTRYLNAGADGFFEHPVDPEELCTSVKLLLRRMKNRDHIRDISEFVCGDLYIDYHRRLVRIAGREIELTPQEYGLLKELTRHAGTTLGYRHLLSTVWGPQFSEEKQYLYVYMWYLRKKIEVDPHRPRHIITVTRVGYVFKTGEKTE